MFEGEVLKAFIENQRASKVKIANDLGMTRSNLYQIFASQKLSPETKQKFENYFKTKIFTDTTYTLPIQKNIIVAEGESEYKYVESLKTENNHLKQTVDLLKKIIEDKDEIISLQNRLISNDYKTVKEKIEQKEIKEHTEHKTKRSA